jgi:AraC-like DNA-binding protein
VQGSERDHERFTSIFNYLFYHHDETIKLDSISSELFISKYYLSHYIKRVFGYTLKQALYYCRTEESVIDLLDDKMTIAEVAAKHGFPSVRSYNELFPRYYGVTPAEYRRRHLKETVKHKDFAGEEISLDFMGREETTGSTIHFNGCSITVNLPKGSYEVLSVETEKNNISNRMTKLNAKNKMITIDSNCEELILRIKKQ